MWNKNEVNPFVQVRYLLKFYLLQKKAKNFSTVFTIEIKRINQLRVGLSPSNEHRFKHNFANVPSPFCSCGEASESILHFLRFCPLRVSQKRILYRNILLDTNINLLLVPESDFVRLLLYGNPKFNDSINDKLLKHCSTFIEATKRFDIF